MSQTGAVEGTATSVVPDGKGILQIILSCRQVSLSNKVKIKVETINSGHIIFSIWVFFNEHL